MIDIRTTYLEGGGVVGVGSIQYLYVLNYAATESDHSDARGKIAFKPTGMRHHDGRVSRVIAENPRSRGGSLTDMATAEQCPADQ